MNPTPVLSVILPLIDDRGHGLEALRAWLAQDASEVFEIVCVGDRSSRRLADRIAPMLRAQDRVLELSTAGEMELYQAGGEAARAGVLLFTEAHCLPARDVVSTVARRAAESDAAGWVLGGGSIPSNEFAGFEARLLLEGRDKYSQDAWRLLSLRGLAVRREAWLAMGGFEVSCGRLAESILGVRLERAGLRVERCTAARVEHGNCERPAELAAALRPHGRGQAVWRERCERGREREFLPPLPDWADRARWRRPMARNALRLGLATGRPARTLLGPLVGSIFGPAAPRLLAAARARAALFTSRIAFGPERRYRAYGRASSELLRWGVLEHAARSPLPAAPNAAGELRPADLPDGVFAGFYPAELWSAGDATPSCRWTRPLATMRFALPVGDYRLALRVHLPSGTSPEDLGLWWNGQRLAVEADGTCRIERRKFRRGEQLLGFTSPPFFPAQQGLDDPRELGIALFAVSLELEATP